MGRGDPSLPSTNQEAKSASEVGRERNRRGRIRDQKPPLMPSVLETLQVGQRRECVESAKFTINARGLVVSGLKQADGGDDGRRTRELLRDR